jgi:hypothetical protein
MLEIQEQAAMLINSGNKLNATSTQTKMTTFDDIYLLFSIVPILFTAVESLHYEPPTFTILIYLLTIF